MQKSTTVNIRNQKLANRSWRLDTKGITLKAEGKMFTKPSPSL